MESYRKKIAEFPVRVTPVYLDVTEITFPFATKLYRWLTVDRKMILKEAAAKKQIKNNKQLLSLAEAHDYIGKNPIQRFRCGGDAVDIPPLEFYEVTQIWQKQIAIQRLAEIRDVFIFQCFTSFTFQDVYSLTEENIVRVGFNGEKWLIKERGKTGVAEMVPIMPIAEEIIKRYKTHPCRTIQGRLLPVNSNARYNGYLKGIAAIIGINRDLNTHLARRTFADIMLNSGVPLEDVSKVLGHKSIRTTQRYAQVRKQRISDHMRIARDRLFTVDGHLRKSV